MAGAPSLAANLSYSPFESSRRKTAVVMPRMDGFSDDGLSYSVANDFNKIAAQALADYEARIGYERQKGLSIDSRGIVNAVPVSSDIQSRIYNETIMPVQQLFGGGGDYGFRNPQPIVRGDPSAGIFERNPQTGEWDNVVPPAEKPPGRPQEFTGPTEMNIYGKPAGMRKLTAQDWLNIGPSLDPRIATNAPVASYIDFGRQSNALSAPISAPQVPTQIPPMPRSKSELRTGVTYQTPRGPAKWDGSKFVQ